MSTVTIRACGNVLGLRAGQVVTVEMTDVIRKAVEGRWLRILSAPVVEVEAPPPAEDAPEPTEAAVSDEPKASRRHKSATPEVETTV